MKTFVFLLVLGNLLFFAFSEGYFGRPDNPDAGRMQQQLNPERIRVVSRGEPPTAKEVAAAQAAEAAALAKDEGEKEEPTEGAKGPVQDTPQDAAKEAPKESPKEAAKDAKEPTKDKPAPDICLAWSGLSAKDADRLGALVADKYAAFKVARQATPVEGGQWWVFIPPLPTKADADKKAGELKHMGATDFFVIQEAGPNRFAISLGVFSSQSGAEDRLAELKGLGVRSAKVGPRSKDALFKLEARGPATAKAALADAVRRLLPDAESSACK